MQVGDLVKFNGGPAFENARAHYAASGVIIKVSPTEAPRFSTPGPYTVLWADGKTTYELFSYLEVLNESR